MLPKLMWILLRVLNDRSGEAAIDYGLMASLIALACITALVSLGLNLAAIVATIGSALA